jgi:hypothetical protein
MMLYTVVCNVYIDDLHTDSTYRYTVMNGVCGAGVGESAACVYDSRVTGGGIGRNPS